jgi:hypothetical protein
MPLVPNEAKCGSGMWKKTVQVENKQVKTEKAGACVNREGVK